MLQTEVLLEEGKCALMHSSANIESRLRGEKNMVKYSHISNKTHYEFLNIFH